MNTPPLLSMRRISKRFPGVVALDGVNLEARRGEVVALVGENGAGKSTLMKILGGVYQPDAGEIVFDGQPARIQNVMDAMRRGGVVRETCPEGVRWQDVLRSNPEQDASQSRDHLAAHKSG